MKYGILPTVIGHFPITCQEAMFCLYLPISLAGQRGITVPDPYLRYFTNLVWAVREDIGEEAFTAKNIYLTAKHMYVSPGITANRPGWHSDGFLTHDLNYVWYDALPTVFNNSAFEVEADHLKSLDQFWPQAAPENDVRYPAHTLLKLDQYVIHRVDEAQQPLFRTFVKISVSADQYNLTGNSHNYALDYDWPMHERLQVRNTPAVAQRDAIN